MMREPEAWLIRRIRGSKAEVFAGHVYKSKAAAEAAALRLTNHWQTCIAFPVISMEIDGA